MDDVRVRRSTYWIRDGTVDLEPICKCKDAVVGALQFLSECTRGVFCLLHVLRHAARAPPIPGPPIEKESGMGYR